MSGKRLSQRALRELGIAEDQTAAEDRPEGPDRRLTATTNELMAEVLRRCMGIDARDNARHDFGELRGTEGGSLQRPSEVAAELVRALSDEGLTLRSTRSEDGPGTLDVRLLAFQAAIPGTCDWGGCDNNALLARFDPEKGWLPVCQWHAGDASAADLAPITAVALEEAWAALSDPTASEASDG